MHTKTPESTLADAHTRYSTDFRRRRFLNWFPLGLTYATFYMGRYNFNVVKGMMGQMFHLDKAEMGLIATAGFWTYAMSVMFAGPLADRLGGRKAIIFGGVGTALLNLLIGSLFLSGWSTKVLVGMSLLYSVNMFFQSFGALSVVKVNSSWFHVKERGVFGGIFGSMISLGYMFALSVGGWILSTMNWTMIFLIPAVAILTMVLIDYWYVYDRPSQAGLTDFDVGDAASGEDDKPASLRYIAKRVFGNPVILTIAAAEFCTGFVRQGLLLYFVEFLKEVHHVDLASWTFGLASTGITVGGIAGGLLCGWMSDRLFGSRRAPVAFIFYCMQVVSLLALGFAPSPIAAAFLIGFCCMWIFGVHGMLSGTASMDFGGRKAAATAAGLLDGIQYVGGSLTGVGLGWILKTYGWDGIATAGHQASSASIWVLSILPFSVLGGLIILPLWNAHPSKNAH
jgi:OPA family glycerol-3-phosphate transporter-like MFS transporter